MATPEPRLVRVLCELSRIFTGGNTGRNLRPTDTLLFEMGGVTRRTPIHAVTMATLQRLEETAVRALKTS